MSVLLDALKKAAEEKKQQSQQNSNDTFGSVINQKSDSSSSKASKSGYFATQPDIDLSKNDAVQSKKKDDFLEKEQVESHNSTLALQDSSQARLEENEQTTLTENVSTPEFGLQLKPADKVTERGEFLLEEESNEPNVSVSANNTVKLTEVDYADSDDTILESRQVVDDGSTSNPNFSPSLAHSSMSPISEQDEEMLAKANENFTQSLLIRSVSADDNASRSPLDQEQESKLETEVSSNSNVPPLSSEVDQANELIEQDHSKTESDPVPLSEAVKKTDETENLQSHEDTALVLEKERNPELAKDVDESYGWKMDELPGYQSLPEEADKLTAEPDDSSKESTSKRPWKLNKKNAVLTKGENRKVYLSSSKLSKIFDSKLLYFSLFMGALAAIFIFGLFYYQEQSETLDQKFVKYRIERIETSLQPPKVEIADPLAQESSAVSEDSVAASLLPEKAAQLPESEADGIELNEQSQFNGVESTLLESDITDVAVNEKVQTKNVTATQPPTKPIVDDTQKATLIKPLVTPEPSKEKAPRVTTKAESAPKTLDEEKLQEANDALVEMKKQLGLTNEARLLKEAYAAYKVQNWPLAQLRFQEVLELNPQNLKALLGLATSQLQQQSYTDSVATYKQVLRLDSKNQYAYEGLVVVAGLSQQNAGLQDALGQVLEIYPSSAILQNAMGNLMAKQQLWQEAQTYYFNALAVQPNNPTFNLNFAVSLDHLRKFALAKDYYQKALVLHDDGMQQTLPIDTIKRRIAALKIYLDQEGS